MIFAAGQTGNEDMTLEVNGEAVQAWTAIGTQLSGFVFQLDDNVDGDAIRVRFTNDQNDPVTGADYNLTVDRIEVDDVVYETEHASVFSTGTWLPTDGVTPGFRQSDTLHSNGYFQYAAAGGQEPDSDPEPGEGSEVTIFASGQTGNETMVLHIGGFTVQSWSNVGTELTAYSYTANSAVAADDVRINFTNDQFDPATNSDRNLTVDRIEIDGIAYETEDSSVFSTGTWLPEDGVTPGFRESETLHSNGYFQYAGALVGSSTLTFDVASVVVNEDDGVTELNVTRTGDGVGEVSIGYNTIAQTAVAGEDFEETSGQLVFADGVTSQTISIPLIDDNVEESVESFVVQIVSAVGAAEGEITSLEVEITDDDAAGSITLSANYYIVAEDDGSAVVTINRIGGSNGEVSIDYATNDITALAGDDYTAQNGTLVFADGVTSQTVTIPLSDDNIDEDGEQFSFVLENPQGGVGLLSPRTATIEISDGTDDGGDIDSGPGNPEDTVTTEVLANVVGAVAIEWLPGGEMLIADFGGRSTSTPTGRSTTLNRSLTFAMKSTDLAASTTLRCIQTLRTTLTFTSPTSTIHRKCRKTLVTISRAPTEAATARHG